MRLLENTALGKAARRLRERLAGTRVPDLASAQPRHIGEILPYEEFLEYEGCTFVLLSDGSLGLAWSLGLVGHEVLTGAQLTYQMQAVVQAIDAVTREKATLQIIWDSTPSARFPVPAYDRDPKTYAQRVMRERLDRIRGLSTSETGDLRCIRRQMWLTLRWQRPRSAARAASPCSFRCCRYVERQPEPKA